MIPAFAILPVLFACANALMTSQLITGPMMKGYLHPHTSTTSHLYSDLCTIILLNIIN